MRFLLKSFVLAVALLFVLSGEIETLQAQVWKLSWSDEFQGPKGAAPDAGKWTIATGAGGWGNGELETYCAPGSAAKPCVAAKPNLYMDGKGHLVIRAMVKDGKWTSGRMDTSKKKSFLYGRVEARMKLAVGDGFWPAFWMLGDNIDEKGVGWPISGEQDIMEWVQSYGSGRTSSTIHGPGYSGGNGIGSKYTFPHGERIDDAGYHTYGVIWTKDKMQFYRDNPSHPYFTVTPANLPAGTRWVYNHPFFVLLNFAIGGGGFPGLTDSTTPKSAKVLVDYVRVYELAKDPAEAIDPQAWYSIASQQGAACVAAGKKHGGDAAELLQQSCNAEQKQQRWQLAPSGNGRYNLTSAKKPAIGWQLVATDKGAYELVARDGRCAAVAGDGFTAKAAELHTAVCSESAAQLFFLTQQAVQ
jgi:beta-glucanase (GH16 family)